MGKTVRKGLGNKARKNGLKFDKRMKRAFLKASRRSATVECREFARAA